MIQYFLLMASLKSCLLWVSLIFVFNIINTQSLNKNTLLLLVSFDGFRYDYITRDEAKFFLSLKENSSSTAFMKSVFPSKTFVNHFSIATGLYTETHGVMDNQFWDAKSNQSLNYGWEMFHYNEDVVPIWALNEQGGGGRHSGCMMWAGSNFAYQGVGPSHFLPYNKSFDWNSRVDIVMDWFTDKDTPINLGVMYFEQPDADCHMFGPNSTQVNNDIARVDKIVKYILEKVSEAGMKDRLNIIFVSDHGGQAVPVPSNLIKLDDYVDHTWYNVYGVPPNYQIYPLPGFEAKVLTALKDARKKGGKFSTFSKEEMPERWHYKNSARTPPILLCADVGYSFLETWYNITKPTTFGTHGYDPETTKTMRAIFMAMGPAFKKGYQVDPFENVNIYPLIANILGLSLPKVKPNGSLSVLEEILSNDTRSNKTLIFIVVGLIQVLCLVVLIFGGIILFRRYRQR